MWFFIRASDETDMVLEDVSDEPINDKAKLELPTTIFDDEHASNLFAP